MTQIISVITQDYALLVSDRLQLFSEGPLLGKEFEDDNCKLVSLCNACGIGYAGLACLDGSPTHEWIAKTLTAANCHDPDKASKVLMDVVPRAMLAVSTNPIRQIFSLSGWAFSDSPPKLRPHFYIVENCLDDTGKILEHPRPYFRRSVRALKDSEQFLLFVIGEPLAEERENALKMNTRQLISRFISPKEALRLLAEGVIYTHQNQKRLTVSDKVLGFCIPKRSVNLQFSTGHSITLPQLPNDDAVSFTYFDPRLSELHPFSPTYVCGKSFTTNIQAASRPDEHSQSSQMDTLSASKK